MANSQTDASRTWLQWYEKEKRVDDSEFRKSFDRGMADFNKFPVASADDEAALLSEVKENKFINVSGLDIDDQGVGNITD